jgi:hypothetical protein
LEWDFLPIRELDLADEAREFVILVRVANSSGLTRDSDSIPIGPCAVVRRGEGSSSNVADTSLDFRSVERLSVKKTIHWRGIPRS